MLTTSFIFGMIITIFIGETLLTQYLKYINIQSSSEEIPPEVAGIYDTKKYATSQKYERVKYNFSQWYAWTMFAIMWGVLIFWWFGTLDSWLRGFTDNPILLALGFFGSITLISTVIGLPFSYYSTFVIEEEFWFNKMTKHIFFTDKIKSLFLSACIGWPLLALVVWIYGRIWVNFWLYAWGIATLFAIGMMMVYSTWIVPLFNKQTPLEPWKLRKQIDDFAKSVDFPLDEIYVIDGSKRSSKANAYFTGFGSKKRIVLYDTLIEDLSTDQLVSVLAHEIGHYKKKHTLYMLCLSIIQTGIILYIFSLALNIPEVSYALWGSYPSFHLWAVAFGILFTPISMIFGMMTNIFSRKNEFEADAYAKETSSWEDLSDALIALSRNNLANLQPHPAYVFIYYSHPPVLVRLKALKYS